MKFKMFGPIFTFIIGTLCLCETSCNTLIKNIANKNELKNKCSLITNTLHIECCESETIFSGRTHTFVFESNHIVRNITALGNASLNSYNIVNKTIRCVISDIHDRDEITLEFITAHEEKEIQKLYFIEKARNQFSSSNISLDTAMRNAGLPTGYDLMDKEDYDYQIQSGQPLRIGASGTISGTMRWTDQDGHTHPLVGALVRITIAGSWWNGDVYTDQNGYYSKSYNDIWYVGTGKPTATLYLESNNIKVKNGSTYSKNKVFSGNNSSNIFSYTFSPIVDGDIGKAAMLYQGGYEFSKQATYLNGGTPLPMCSITYPNGDHAYYSNNNISIGATIYRTDGYFQWDALGHEYGHHISTKLSFDANPGGEHYFNGNNIDKRFNEGESLSSAKEKGLSLSWSEGFATYFSIAAQEEFPMDLQSIEYVGDTYYYCGPYSGLGVNIDSYDDPLGDGCEATVSRMLYKMVSPIRINDVYDNIEISKERLFALIKTHKPKRFDEFIDACYDECITPHHSLGLLMSMFSITTYYLTIENNYINVNPTLKWSINKGCNAFKYNDFDLKFENSNGDFILFISHISITDASFASYTLTTSEWTTVKTSHGVFRVFVVSRQTDYFTTGNYWSQLFEIPAPSSFR